MCKKILKEKIINDGDTVYFVSKTEKYGIAEFQICPVIKRGKLIEIFIYPMQQPDAMYFYRIPINGRSHAWQVSSWTHKRMEAPRIWLMFWCKEHKCQAFNVCVPKNSKKFKVSILSTASLDFDF